MNRNFISNIIPKKHRIIAWVLACCMIFAALPVATAVAADNNENNWNNPFTDVKSNDWYYNAVNYANSNQIMLGVTADLFQPNTPTDRAMIVTTLWRAAGSPKPDSTAPFTDLNAGAYYIDAVAWANENDIVNGIDATHFAPAQEISREQMAAIIYRYAKSQKVDVSQNANNKPDLTAYNDADQIAPYALDSVKWVLDTEIINGKNTFIIAPKDNLTRAEAATFFMRYAQKITK